MNESAREPIPEDAIQGQESIEYLRRQVEYYKEQAAWWKKDHDQQLLMTQALQRQIKTWEKVLDIIDRSMKHSSHGY